ncbi:MAG: 4Fe-4S binding protein [Deltaproteobacteria bacterium]
MKGFDLEHCKGCGICAVECPDKVKAITMEEEAS